MPRLHPVDLVDPYVGSIGHLLTATQPNVMLPHGMGRTMPLFNPGVRDIYVADRIYAMSAFAAQIMVGKSGSATVEDFSAQFDHELEEAHPYGYSAQLFQKGISLEATATQHCVALRFRSKEQGLALMIRYPESLEYAAKGNAVTLSGTVEAHHGGKPVPNFLHIELNGDAPQATRLQGAHGVVLNFGNYTELNILVALSYIDAEQARENCAKELVGKYFDDLHAAARRKWMRTLTRIQVKGGTLAERRTFYTALYRAHCRMVNIGEYGRYWSGYDGKIHRGVDFYTEDGLWDTYRCMHPLQLILEPGRQSRMVDSYIRMYRQSGWMPSFPGVNGDRPVMIGFHASAMIADAAVKGLGGFDLREAYQGMKKNAMGASLLPWRCDMGLTDLDEIYHKHGYFPALNEGQEEFHPSVHEFEGRQAVAVTLEHAYDDFCVGQVAGLLGEGEDAAFFFRRAQNYRNLFDPRIGWMAPRNADGDFVQGFDPKWSGGQGGRRYYAENNSWTYSFHVQQDVQGLAELFGGPGAMQAKLDRLYLEQYDGNLKSVYLCQFPDATGLMGQFAMGNEPSFHIPYLYNYCGAPWKAQRRLRDIMRLWFNDTPTGICGDEDGGAMSSWFVFSAMGFYPVCPGKPVYDIGSPIFDEVVITPDGGKPFTIKAEGASDGARYIAGATLNGQPLDKPLFPHDALAGGGELVLSMTKEPSMWGA